MATLLKQLYSPDAKVNAREGRTAADSPAAGAWTPDNLNADEISADVAYKDVVFDGRRWDSVQVMPVFTDGAGAVVDGTSVDVTPLVEVRDPAASNGRIWVALAATGAITDDVLTAVVVEGHLMAFRITAVTLGAATDVGLAITGGIEKRQTAV